MSNTLQDYRDAAVFLSSLGENTYIELYELDTTPIIFNNVLEERVLRFCNISNDKFKNIKLKNINSLLYDQEEFTVVACKIEGSENKGDGEQSPRPKFTIGNYKGEISKIIKKGGGLLGADLTRKIIPIRHIDVDNWIGDGTDNVLPNWVQPDTMAIPILRETYKINKKISESYDYAQFELCNPIDFDDLKLPKRKMFASICTFEYRNTCPYRGEPVSSSDNVPYEERGIVINKVGGWKFGEEYFIGDTVIFNENGVNYYFVCIKDNTASYDTHPFGDFTSWEAEACNKKCSGCLLRFSGYLPISAFPSLSQKGFSR